MHPVDIDAESVREINRELLLAWPLPAAADATDKEDRGHVLVVAGSRQLPGAALLAITAALRAGAGKVTLLTAESAAMALAVAVPEARVIGLPETPAGGLRASGLSGFGDCLDCADALLIGPGLADASATCELVHAVLHGTGPVACVLDALAMDVLQGDLSGGLASGGQRPFVITPHAGEMAHLTGHSKDAVLKQPRQIATTLSRQFGGVVVLKGAETWIAAPDRCVWKHVADIPGLAVSGSGDVLAGLLAGLLARGAPAGQAAVWAVALHAAAGQKLARARGTLGYLPRELMDEIPALMCGELVARPL